MTGDQGVAPAAALSAAASSKFMIDPMLRSRLNGGDGHAELRQLIDHGVEVEIVPGSAIQIHGKEFVHVRPYGRPDGRAVRVQRVFVVTTAAARISGRIASRATAIRARPSVGRVPDED